MPRYATRVVQGANGHDGQCACGFETRGWPSEDIAQARIVEHQREHETREPMQELADFREPLGLNGEHRDVIEFPAEVEGA